MHPLNEVSDKNLVRKVIDACGGYGRTVDAIMEVWRRIWRDSFGPDGGTKEVLEIASLTAGLPLEAIAPVVLNLLEQNGLCYTEGSTRKVGVLALQPMLFVRALAPTIRTSELRYFVRRNIRNKYDCQLSSQTVRLLRSLSHGINCEIQESNSESWSYHERLLPLGIKIIEAEPKHYQPEKSEDFVLLFLEACLGVGYLRADVDEGKQQLNGGNVRWRNRKLDAEFLISNLFGVPSGVHGFDELFGGGLILPESTNPTGAEQAREIAESELPPRMLLVIGPFGTGKSLVSLQLALSVARKQGIAWIMPLEQSVEECIYTMEVMGLLPADDSVLVVTSVSEAKECLDNPPQDRGVLILLKTIKDSYADFLYAFKENAERMSRPTPGRQSLRLLVADPVNCISRVNETDLVKLRAETRKAIEDVKRLGTNVMFVAEETSGHEFFTYDSATSGTPAFEENIADTVIRLSCKKGFDYTQRYFEITKSRFQREQRGEHPFSIIPGEGIHIVPSSAAINARIKLRGGHTSGKFVKFGVHALEKELGEDAIEIGNVIVLQGQSGCFKTELGIKFLMETDGEIDAGLTANSLFISARNEGYKVTRLNGQGKPIRTISLESGFVHPGSVFDAIDRELFDARIEKCAIDRIMIDNIGHWELTCPYIRADQTFGTTLVNFLRRRRLTSLLVCGASSEHLSLQKSITDSAQVIINFDRRRYRGVQRVLLSISKTAGMLHNREALELIRDGSEFNVKRSLLRLGENGELTPIHVRLFFHVESTIQQEYNHKLEGLVQSVIEQNARIESQGRIYMTEALRAGSYSAVDELQILQLDSFQVPQLARHGPTEGSCLHRLGVRNTQQQEYLPRLIAPPNQIDANALRAVPYFCNISLLAYRRGEIPPEAATDWSKLAELCQQWENKKKKKNSDPHSLFFDFPKANAENYNCLFFEILLSIHPVPETEPQCSLLTWLKDSQFVVACKIFRALCRRAHLRALSLSESESNKGEAISVDTNAIVWRHWYTTLNHMMRPMPREDRNQICIQALPGGISVAGDWYLAVPAHSSAPDIGREIIKLLTSPERELERLQSGVGLPTRTEFYSKGGAAAIAISPYFSLMRDELRRLVHCSFNRSRFDSYSSLSGILAYSLQRIIEVEVEGKDAKAEEIELEEKIICIRDELESKIRFLGSDNR
jgi:KaiC/GvpD/RAD55 family RecA-like ATPase